MEQKTENLSILTNCHNYAGYIRLAIGIIQQAIKDYVICGRKIKALEKNNKKIPALLNREYIQAKNFFETDWFTLLAQGKITKDYLVRKCEQLIDFENQIGPDGTVMGRKPTKDELYTGLRIIHNRILTCLK